MAGYEARGATLSRRIWDLDWATHLPWTFGDIAVEVGTFRDDAAPFIAEHYAAIFGTQDPSRFFVEATSAAKRHFGDEMDVLCFRDAGRTIGILVGHPVDWSTYYFRTVALLPEYRDQGLFAAGLKRAHQVLAVSGADRAEGECSPTNLPMMRALTKLGYVVTATVNSERWGATVRFTKHLRPEAEAVFVRQFCAVHVRSA
jgi:RimJ/RimL family protein N-acetyltransferase